MAGFDVVASYRSVEDYLVRVHGSQRDLAIDELDVLAAYAARIVGEIEAAWPVDTSTSRDAFFYTLLTFPDIGFTVSNDADYAEWVHYKGDPTPLVESLVDATIDRYSPMLIAELRAAIDETEQRAAENAAKGGRGLVDILSRRFKQTGVPRAA